MADTPPNQEDPRDPESLFLIALWNELDPAAALSTEPNAIQNLPIIQTHLEGALGLIARWPGP